MENRVLLWRTHPSRPQILYFYSYYSLFMHNISRPHLFSRQIHSYRTTGKTNAFLIFFCLKIQIPCCQSVTCYDIILPVYCGMLCARCLFVRKPDISLLGMHTAPAWGLAPVWKRFRVFEKDLRLRERAQTAARAQGACTVFRRKSVNV